MAQLFGDKETFQNSHPSEKRVAKFLQKFLNEKFLIWHEPYVGSLKPDFLVLSPQDGFIIIEVKSWNLDYILEADSYSVTLNSHPPKKSRHPVNKQAQEYALKAVDILKSSPDLLYPQNHARKGNLLIPYGCCVIFTKIHQKQLNRREELKSLRSKAIFQETIFNKNANPKSIQNSIINSLPYRLEQELSTSQIDSFISTLHLSKVELDILDVSEESDQVSTEQTVNPISKIERQSNSQFIHPKTKEENSKDTISSHSSKQSQPNNGTYNSLSPHWLFKGIAAFFVLISIGFIIKIVPWITKVKVSDDSIVIGTLWTPQSQQKLSDYIESKVVPDNFFEYLRGSKVSVLIDGDKTLSYQEAQKRIENKSWDIAFTLSPILSVTAQDSGYTWAASMFPESESYQSGIFVKTDSNIQSLADINTNTIIALGGFDSASSFYYPVYDLYGKTVNVRLNNRGQKIIELVKSGQVDAGAAAIGDAIRTNDPELRLIHISREIPGAGVYLSPELSSQEQNKIQSLLMNASLDIQEASNYGKGQEPDFTYLRQLTRQVEEILICSDFSSNPVQLFCSTEFLPVAISGQINGASFIDNLFVLRVVDGSNIYNVKVSQGIVAEAVKTLDLSEIQGKYVEILVPDQNIVQTASGKNVEVTQPRQINFRN